MIGTFEDASRDSVAGRGKVTAETQIAEMLVEVGGDFTLHKGTRTQSGRSLIGNLVLPLPIGAEIRIPVEVRRIDNGRFGWTATAEVPRIAAGAGSITGYSARIGKRFLTATCVGGRLDLRTVSSFADGTRLRGRVTRPCAVAETDAAVAAGASAAATGRR